LPIADTGSPRIVESCNAGRNSAEKESAKPPFGIGEIMSKRFVAVALLLASLSTPVVAAARRDDGDQSSRSVISRLFHRIIQTLDDWSWPKP
jgi:hypothetical protein